MVAARRSASLLGIAVPVGLEIPLGARGVTLVLILEGGGRGAPPEGLLGKWLQDEGSFWRSIGPLGRDAAGQEKYCQNISRLSLTMTLITLH